MNETLRRIVKTEPEWGATVARLVLGLVMFPHAAQKVFGWFGGGGISGTIGFFESIGIPSFLAALVIAAEFLGSLALLLGAFGRLGAAAVSVVMLGAIAKVHWANGFFMNWFGQQAGEGFEYHLLALGLAAVVLIRGSGAASIDAALGGGETQA
ncbi:MAG: DoxX family protein [Gemmatimonadetes bacterium]|nr:MAG: DoxX family protein [Gemmatimonadota bacterium]